MARTPYSLNSYTGGAGAAYLTGSGIGAADTTITITGTTGGWVPLGTAGGWYLDLDYGTPNEEKVYVASGTYAWSSGLVTISGITRGIDQTTAVVHSGGGMPSGVVCTPVITSLDTSEANAVANLIFYPNGMINLPQSVTITGTVGVTAPVFNTVTNSGQISVGGMTFNDVNNLASFTASGNNYLQVTTQNTTSGTDASTSFVANNNLATSGTYFAEFGINSSAFSGTGVFNTPNAGYVAVSSGELGLGTYNGGGVHLVVSGNEALVVSGTGQSWANNWATYPSMPASYLSPYKAWTVDPALATTTVTLITGTAYYTAIWVPNPITLSGISFYSSTFAATDTAYVALFNNTTQLATCSGLVGGTTGLNKCLISGGTYSITTPGLYYVGLVISGSTSFVFNGTVAGTAALINMNITPTNNSLASLRIASVVIGQRALYGTSGSVSGVLSTTTQVPFFALS